MGFWDGWDGDSVISRKSSRHHLSSKHHKSHRSKSRDRSPGARSTRSRHSTGGVGIAASLFGGEESHRHKRSNSRARSIFGGEDKHRRSNSRARSIFGGEDKHRRSSSGFFGLPNVSKGSFFGFNNNHRSSSSYYKRSPRANFVTRAYKQLKRLLRDLVYYAKRHPWKVFALVIMPLITGGALTALLARFGLRLPPSIERMMGLGAKAMGGGSIGLVGEAVRMAGNLGGDGGRVSLERGHGGGLEWERKSFERDGFGGGGDGWFGGGGGGLMKTIGKWL